ncbi:MAG TPA: PEP-CTERM sorting domain-containing protein [Fimbriimonadaceae bacterium]|nr:PEP-CTERM sorting domain-containing protein [Fimbriimonadaceae bacterium]HRJ97750.1 PEP-CTERM sorting domain-containing protein [Fimbriimonadaceae bacterium]
MLNGDVPIVPVGNTGVTGLCGLERHPTNGFLYGFTSGAQSKLYKIDPWDATATEIGALNIGFVFEGSLVFGPNGTAYGCNAGEAERPVFFTLNLTTGRATRVETIGSLPHDVNGLAFRSDGKLAGFDRESSRLLIFRPQDGVITESFELPLSIGEVGGMTVLEDVAYLNTSGIEGIFPGSNQLFKVDLMTGQTELWGPMTQGFPAGTGCSGLAAVPEPASLIGLALGTLALLRRSRRTSK